MKVINGESIPNLPWEDKPSDCKDVVWRSKNNPIITRDFIKNSNSIFNSAVVPFEGGFAGVFRSDDTMRIQRLHVGRSADGVHWDLDDEPIRFMNEDGGYNEFEYGYDPRVCKIEDKYYVTWCNGYKGFPKPRISRHLFSTKTHFCRLTETVCCSREKSTEITQ